MKLQLVAIIAVYAVLLHESQGQSFLNRTRDFARNFVKSVKTGMDNAREYVEDFAGGANDMRRAYNDMREANTIGADKYFHARGNYDAAQRGTGGRHAAAIISNAREAVQTVLGRGADDSEADQVANRWGRNRGNPNVYRPRGLDEKY